MDASENHYDIPSANCNRFSYFFASIAAFACAAISAGVSL